MFAKFLLLLFLPFSSEASESALVGHLTRHKGPVSFLLLQIACLLYVLVFQSLGHMMITLHDFCYFSSNFRFVVLSLIQLHQTYLLQVLMMVKFASGICQILQNLLIFHLSRFVVVICRSSIVYMKV